MIIANWNMQGASHSTENKWNTGVSNLLRTADVICLQECGAVPASAQLIFANVNGIAGLDMYTWGTARTLKYILFYPSDPNGNRCNLAVVSNIAILNPANDGYLLFPAAAPIWRPVIGLDINGIGVFTIHAISPGGNDAPGLLNSVAGFMGANPWTVSGDYNRDPNSLAGTGIVCPPDQNTYSVYNPQSRLDFLIKSGGGAIIGQVINNLILSDHYPVIYNV